jgi:hypothetical protein
MVFYDFYSVSPEYFGYTLVFENVGLISLILTLDTRTKCSDLRCAVASLKM